MLIQEAILQEKGIIREGLKDLFSTCPKMAQISMETREKGDYIAKEGAPCDTIYVLLSGEGKVLWNEPGIAQYSAILKTPLTIIGDLDILAGRDTYSASIRIVQKSRFLCMTKKDFNLWLEGDPALYKRLVQANLRLLQQQAKEMRKNAGETTIVRIMSYLKKIYITSSKGADDTVRIPLNRNEIAEGLGNISTRTLNRYITKLENEDCLSIEKGKIAISKTQFKNIQKVLDEEGSY